MEVDGIASHKEDSVKQGIRVTGSIVSEDGEALDNETSKLAHKFMEHIRELGVTLTTATVLSHGVELTFYAIVKEEDLTTIN